MQQLPTVPISMVLTWSCSCFKNSNSSSRAWRWFSASRCSRVSLSRSCRNILSSICKLHECFGVLHVRTSRSHNPPRTQNYKSFRVTHRYSFAANVDWFDDILVFFLLPQLITVTDLNSLLKAAYCCTADDVLPGQVQVQVIKFKLFNRYELQVGLLAFCCLFF